MNFINNRKKKSMLQKIGVYLLISAIFLCSGFIDNLQTAYAAEKPGNTAVKKEEQATVSGGTIPGKNEVLGAVRSTESGQPLLHDFELYKASEPDKPLASGSTVISSTDALIINYNLIKLLVDAVTNPGDCNVADGNTYTFSVPIGLNVTQTTEIPVEVKVGGVDRVMGTLKYDNINRRMELVFDHSDIFDGSIEFIDNAYIGFTAELDKSAFTNGDEEQTIDFGFGAESQFTFTYGDNVKTDSTIGKTGVASGDEITWTVEVTEGNKVYGGMVFKDELPSNQDYIPGSFTFDGTSMADTYVTAGTDGKVNIEYPYTPDNTLGNKHTITYRTKFNQRAYVGNGDKVLSGDNILFETTNKAELFDDKNVKIGDAAATVESGSSKNLQWMDKEGSSQVVGGDLVTTWTIEVDTNGFEFDELTVHDKMTCKPVNPTESEFLVVPDSVKVTKTSGTNPMPYGPSSLTMSAAAGSTAHIKTGNDTGKPEGNGKFEWELKLDGDKTKGKYIITYDTKITNYEKYRRYNQKPMENTANLTFEWPDYDGPGVDRVLGTPDITKQAGMVSGSSIIKKDAGVYNKKNHEVKWHITVNSEKVPQSDDVYLIERLNGRDNGRKPTDLNQEYVRIEGLKINGTPDNDISKLTCTAQPDGEYKIEFGNPAILNGQQIEFDFITRLTEADYYESNTDGSRRCFNTVTMWEGTTSYSSVDAAVVPKNVVLKKNAGAYDYNTHKLIWSIEVNEDAMELKGATIEDTVTTGTLNEVRVDNVLIGTVPAAFYYEYDSSSNLLQVHLGDIDAKHTLTYTTTVEPDTVITDGGVDKTLASYNGDITFTNTAKLKKESSVSVPESTASKKITNQIAKKTVGDGGEKDTAKFTIYLNQTQKHWPAGLQMKDVMSPGLILNLASVKLCEATVKADGKWAEGAEVNKSAYTRQVSILEEGNTEGVKAGSTKFVFTLPDNAGNKAYILTYLASVDEATSEDNFTNKVSATGVTSDNNMADVSVARMTLKAYGGGVAGQKSKVKVVKKNEAGTRNLSGAVFALKCEGQTIAKATTGADGSCFFSDLVQGTEYQIEEIAAPAGYLLGTGTNAKETFTAKAKGDIYYLNNPLIFNDARSSFHITKKDGTGKELSGAVFGLFDETETSYTAAKAIEVRTSDANGVVAFASDAQGVYQIAEISSPAGYLKTSTILIAELDANGAVSAIYDKSDAAKAEKTEVTNNKIQAIQFAKKDNNGNILPGAVFGIYNQGDDVATATPLKTAASDGEGKVTFTAMPVAAYQIAEISAPAGYVKDNRVFEAVMNADGTVDKIYDKADASKQAVTEVINREIKDIELTKKDNSGNLLSGAVFGIYNQGDNVATATPIRTAVSDAAGKVTFTAMPVAAYQIAEISAPAGYVKDNRVFEAVMNADGTVDKIYDKTDSAKQAVTEIINNKIKEIHLIKTDDGGKGLEGAVFGLYAENADIGKDNPIETATSDSVGNVVFTTKTAGKYKIAEIEAPAGYIKSDIVLAAGLNADGSVDPLYKEGDDTRQEVTGVENVKVKEESGATNPGTGKPGSGDNRGSAGSSDVSVQSTYAKAPVQTGMIPKTGREGRTIYYVIGIALFISGGVILVYKGKKRNEKKTSQ